MRNKLLVLAIFVCALAVLGDKPAFATKAHVIIASAESFIKSEQYSEALKLARELTEEYPDNVNGWMILAYCQSLLGNYTSSNLAYEKVLVMGADPAAVYRQTAYNYIKLQNWNAARASYFQILEFDGDDIETLLELGLLETELENNEKALYYYRKVLSLEPDNVTAMSGIAKLLDKPGSSSEARAMLENAMAVDRENTKFLRELSSMHMKERNYNEAFEVLRKLAVLDSTNASVHQNLGIASYQLGHKGIAAGEFEKVKKLGGSLDGFYGPLADCLQSSGQPGKALIYIHEGLQEGKQHAWLYSIWGKILEDERDYDGAIAKFFQAAALGEEPWSDYAREQIVRQQELKQQKEMLAKQAAEM